MINYKALLYHATAALVVTLLLYPLFHWQTFLLIAGLFYGREQSQFQTELAKKLNLTRMQIWYRGWFIFNWGWDHILQYAVPSIISIILILTINYY